MDIETIKETLELLAENIATDTEAAYDPMLHEDDETIEQCMLSRMDVDASFHLIPETEDLAERLYSEAQEEWKLETGKEDDGEDEAYEFIMEYMGDLDYMIEYSKRHNLFRFFWSPGDYFDRASWTYEPTEDDTPETVVETFYEWVSEQNNNNKPN